MSFNLSPTLLNAAAERAIIGGPDEDRGVKRFLIVLPGETAAAIGIANEIELVVYCSTYHVRFGLSEANDTSGRTVLRWSWQPVESDMQAVGSRYALRSPAHAALDLVRVGLEHMRPIDVAA
jgi:hypothetical protein